MAASQLLSTEKGRLAMNEIVCYLAHRRMSRFFKGRFAKEAYRVLSTPGAVLSTAAVLGEFNDQYDDEVLGFYNFLSQCGSLSESIFGQIIYVDAVNGSDTEGDGSQTAPYASLWFLPGLPRVINHFYRIIFLSDIAVDDISIDQEFGPYGSLAFIGQSAAVEGTQYTVQGFQEFLGINQISLPASVMVNDQLLGQWIRMDSGAAENETFPVLNNTTLNIRYLKGVIGVPNTNDLLTPIRPALTITTPSVSLASHGPEFWEGAGVNDVGSRITFMNLNIDLRGSGRGTPFTIKTDESTVFLSFVRIMVEHAITVAQSIPVTIRGHFNQRGSIDSNVGTYTGVSELKNLNYGTDSGRSPCGLVIHDMDGPYPTGNPQVELNGAKWVEALASTGVIKFSGCVHAHNVGGRIFKTLAYPPCADLNLEECAVCSDPAVASIVCENDNTYLRIYDVSFINNNSGVDLIKWSGARFIYRGSGTYGSDVVGGIGYSGFGMRIETVTTILLFADPDQLTGTLTDDWIFSTNALQDEWPLTGVTTTEGLGSVMTGLF